MRVRHCYTAAKLAQAKPVLQQQIRNKPTPHSQVRSISRSSCKTLQSKAGNRQQILYSRSQPASTRHIFMRSIKINLATRFPEDALLPAAYHPYCKCASIIARVIARNFTQFTPAHKPIFEVYLEIRREISPAKFEFLLKNHEVRGPLSKSLKKPCITVFWYFC